MLTDNKGIKLKYPVDRLVSISMKEFVSQSKFDGNPAEGINAWRTMLLYLQDYVKTKPLSMSVIRSTFGMDVELIDYYFGIDEQAFDWEGITMKTFEVHPMYVKMILTPNFDVLDGAYSDKLPRCIQQNVSKYKEFGSKILTNYTTKEHTQTIIGHIREFISGKLH